VSRPRARALRIYVKPELENNAVNGEPDDGTAAPQQIIETAETGTDERHQEQPAPPPPPSATGGRRARSRRDRKPGIDWTAEA